MRPIRPEAAAGVVAIKGLTVANLTNYWLLKRPRPSRDLSKLRACPAPQAVETDQADWMLESAGTAASTLCLSIREIRLIRLLPTVRLHSFLMELQWWGLRPNRLERISAAIGPSAARCCGSIGTSMVGISVRSCCAAAGLAGSLGRSCCAAASITHSYA